MGLGRRAVGVRRTGDNDGRGVRTGMAGGNPTRLPADQGLFIYATVMAMFIIFWHRANIERMRGGEEHRNERLMLFRRKERVTDNEQH